MAVRIPSDTGGASECGDHRWSSAPGNLIEAEARRLGDQLWKSQRHPTRSAPDLPRCGRRNGLPELSHADLRAAALSFSRRTSAGYDMLAPPHLALVDDQGLEILGRILLAMEIAQLVPKAAQPVKVALIPKRSGKWRGIAIFHAILRVYTKARASYYKAWDDSITDPFIAQGSGRAALDPIWRAAVRAEVAAASDETAAVVTLDIAAFFESIDWQVLRGRALAAGLPEPLVNMAITLYGLPRHVAGDGIVTDGQRPTRGVAPGCHWAMPLAKVYTLEPLRQIAACNLRANFSIFVDDIPISAEGKRHDVVNDIVDASHAILRVIRHDLHADVAMDKVAVVATDSVMVTRIKHLLTLPSSGHAANPKVVTALGGDVAAGQTRHAWAKQANRKARIDSTARRMPRVRRLLRAGGRRTRILAQTGLMPAAGHAAELWGMDDDEMLRLQRLAAAATTPIAARRSLTAVRLIRDDPSRGCAYAPIIRWAREVWNASVSDALDANNADRQGSRGEEEGIPSTWERPALSKSGRRCGGGNICLDDLKRLWRRALPGNVRTWGDIRGPMCAAIMSARRLGWRFKGPFDLVMEDGIPLALQEISPAMVERWAQRAWQHRTERAMAAKWVDHGWQDEKDLADAVDAIEARKGVPAAATAITRMLNKTKVRSAIKHGLTAIAADAVWTKERLHRHGLASSPSCIRCSSGDPDTTHHRAWVCPASTDIRERIATVDQRIRARSAPRSLLWAKGWIPSLASLLPPPADFEMRLWTPDDGEQPLDSLDDMAGTMTGTIFIDGSANTPADPRRRRAGWAVVEIDPSLSSEGQLIMRRAIWGTSPSTWPQTAQAGEFAAAVAAAIVGTSQATIYTDCAAVQKVMSGSAAAGLHPSCLWAGAYREAHAAASGPALMRGLRKVKAHQHARVGESDHDMLCGFGKQLGRRKGQGWCRPTPAAPACHPEVL